MNIQKKTDTSALNLMAVVFSLHPAVQTKVYPMVASPIAGQVKLAALTPLPEDSTTFPAHITDTRHLLKKCQRLLYSVYYGEMGWRPNSKAHTQFEIREEEQLFCDRYDETAIWTAIVDPSRSEVIACGRLLSASLAPNGLNNEAPDLDILGYSGCPDSFREWVKAKGAQRVFEIQRFAIAADYRRFGLPYHLLHVTSIAPTLHDPEAVCVASITIQMTKYAKVTGGIHDPKQNWTICYEGKADPYGPLPIFIFEGPSVTPTIKDFFQARIERQRRGAEVKREMVLRNVLAAVIIGLTITVIALSISVAHLLSNENSVGIGAIGEVLSCSTAHASTEGWSGENSSTAPASTAGWSGENSCAGTKVEELPGIACKIREIEGDETSSELAINDFAFGTAEQSV